MDRRSLLPPVPSQYTVKHGLYLELERFKIDGRSALGHAISRSKAALEAMFPEGPNAAASVLIDMIVYKTVKLEVFQRWDYTTGEAKPTAMMHYINLSNSLRKDLQVLTNMAKAQTPAPDDPDLKEYIETVKRAARAEVVKVDKK